MVQSTSQQRVNWAPACRAKGSVFLEAYRAKDAVFAHHGYPHNRSYTGCHACRKITGGTGWSLHAFGPGDAFVHWCGTRVGSTALAEDVNAAQNPYGTRLVTDRPRAMVDDMLAIRTNSGHQVWGWGGYYSGHKDAMHDELVCTPAQLATGINWSTVRGGVAPHPGPPAPTPPVGDFATKVRHMPQLEQGATGQHVRNMQGLLCANGQTVAIDGNFGPGTKAALAAWQKRAGLTADGVCGPATWARLVGI